MKYTIQEKGYGKYKHKESISRLIKKKKFLFFLAMVYLILSSFWTYVIFAFIVVNLVYTLIKGKRSKEIAELCETYNTQLYVFWRYMTFVSNERPFPFESLTKNLSKFN